MQIPKEIFKAYDIRGIVGKTLTPEIVEATGQALGSEALARKQSSICIGYDGRLSGPELAGALSLGIRKAGVNVIQLGMVATPMVYFAAYELGTACGVMVTGSHNPPDYNGLKMVLAGETLSGETIQSLRIRIETGDLAIASDDSFGTESQHDIAASYISKIASDVKLARTMKIAVDCGNGVAGAYAKKLYEALGCSVQELFCEVDGHFPNHHPDPSVPENLSDLIEALAKGNAEIGLAFDGDGDRLGVVTKDGKIIYPDRQLMLFAEEVLQRNQGATIIYDVKSTRNLAPWIKGRNGKPLMWKTGHSLVKAKIKETSADLAGEMSGHVFFNDLVDSNNPAKGRRWYGFDDGLYSGARLLEILSKVANPSETLNNLPESVSTPEQHIQMQEGEPHALIAALQKSAKFEGATEVITIDGLRVEYADGFGLMRPSNTTPVIVLRFEADSEDSLKRIQNSFRAVILGAAPQVKLPF
jgi:phosphomannomutase/phosphoglucomutase